MGEVFAEPLLQRSRIAGVFMGDADRVDTAADPGPSARLPGFCDASIGVTNLTCKTLALRLSWRPACVRTGRR